MNGSLHDCLHALRRGMRQLAEVYAANLGALVNAAGHGPVPLVSFPPDRLAELMQFDFNGAGMFLVLGEWKNGVFAGGGTNIFVAAAADAMSFDRKAARHVSGEAIDAAYPGLLALGESVIVSAIYMECLADVFQDVVTLDIPVLDALKGPSPPPVQIAAVEFMVRRGQERFISMTSAALARIRAAGVDLAPHYRWPSIPMFATFRREEGEAFNGVWMPKAWADHYRTHLTMSATAGRA